MLHHRAPPVASPRARIYRLRHRAYAALVRLMPAPEREVMAGILLGIESGIPEATREAFNAPGTTHAIAISGFNISIVAGALLGLTRRLPRRWPGWIVALAGVGLYTVLVGGAPSVVRAAIMGSLGILARQIGRRTFALGALATSGALMTAVSPGALWDSGFQLAFAVTFGLVAYADPMQTWVERRLTPRRGVSPCLRSTRDPPREGARGIAVRPRSGGHAHCGG
ncbi:MAG: ComEC/Rec2 family competence protein [Chloroflexi bacterium]|nr:ComEC/Rec2 family competence protein [Chloroflexota bacterium]